MEKFSVLAFRCILHQEVSLYLTLIFSDNSCKNIKMTIPFFLHCNKQKVKIQRLFCHYFSVTRDRVGFCGLWSEICLTSLFFFTYLVNEPPLQWAWCFAFVAWTSDGSKSSITSKGMPAICCPPFLHQPANLHDAPSANLSNVCTMVQIKWMHFLQTL